VTTMGKKLLASLTDAERLAVMKPTVTLLNSEECPIGAIPPQFVQPPEALAAWDTFKTVTEAAHPSDSKLIVIQRNEQRKAFDQTMGDMIDFILLASRRDPSLTVKFGLDSLGQTKSTSSHKMAQLLAIPLLILQAIDKEPGIVHCRVRGGVRGGIEIFIAYDDPTNEANWQRFDSFFNGGFVLPGLTSGRRAYMRGRYVFSQGKKGPWSEMVSIMVP